MVVCEEYPSLEQIACTLRRRGFDDEEVVKMVRAWAEVSRKRPWRASLDGEEDLGGKSRAAKKLMVKRQRKASSGNIIERPSPKKKKSFLAVARAAQTVSRLKIGSQKKRLEAEIATPKENILEDFVFLENGKLGVGAHAAVYVVRSKTNEKQHYACKCIKKNLMGPAQKKGLLQEALLMRSISHTSIVKLWHFYEDAHVYYLVMDLIEGGELFHRIVKRSSYTERKARDCAKKVLEAIAYLHSEGIVHRDVKPENLLCVSEDSDTDVKLCDFGFATTIDKLNPQKCLTRVCGTTAYLAPEIVTRQAYGQACDLWSVGCVVFILLSGYPPFSPQDDDDNNSSTSMVDNIAQGNFAFHSPYWDAISHDAKHFVTRLLTVDPASRMTANEALNHHWITEDATNLDDHDLTNTTLPRLKQYNNAKTKFKNAVGTIVAAKRIANKYWNKQQQQS